MRFLARLLMINLAVRLDKTGGVRQLVLQPRRRRRGVRQDPQALLAHPAVARLTHLLLRPVVPKLWLLVWIFGLFA